MIELTKQLLDSAAGSQWQKIGIRHHHGIVVPLFSLHSQNSCGIGEYADVEALFPWCREIGLDVIQLLPLNDPGQDTSPYCALSAYALNPLHLSLSQLPHVSLSPTLSHQISILQQLNRCQKVDYHTIQVNKEGFLRNYYKQFSPAIVSQPAYTLFKEQNKAWLSDFALFKTLKIQQNWQSWEEWPEELRNPTPESFETLKSTHSKEIDFHCFVQYLCFSQCKRLKLQAAKAGIFIKGDVPILINRESADVWRHKNLFDLNFAAGAPPDMYVEEGQKWGFPIYNWEEMAAQGYKWWIERLRIASQCYHLFRLDHIVGFYRIWGIPLDKIAKDGLFIPEDKTTWIPHGETIMQMMLQHCDMLPIGEDLGTIPPEVRVSMKKLGICGTKVMRWERNWETDKEFIDPREYIPESMTTVSTHDSETLEMWWKDRPEESKVYAESQSMVYEPQLSVKYRHAILKESHHSGSLFHINLLQEYLALLPHMIWTTPDDERINIPGVISDSNWTYRFRPSTEDIVSNAFLKHAMKDIVGMKS